MVSGSPARAPAAALALILGLTLACGYSKPAKPGNPISSGGLGGAGPGAGADGAAPLSADAMSTPSHDGAAALSADAPMPAPDVAAAEATPPTRDAGADAAQLSTDAAVDAGATPDGSPDLAAD